MTCIKDAHQPPGETGANNDWNRAYRIRWSNADDGRKRGTWLCRGASRPGMADPCVDALHLLPGPARDQANALSRVPRADGLCRHPAGEMSFWVGEARLCQMPGSLLSARPARTDQSGDALCRPAHVVAASDFEHAPLARWMSQSAGCWLRTAAHWHRTAPFGSHAGRHG